MPIWKGNKKYYIKVKEPIRGSKKYLKPKYFNWTQLSWKTEKEAKEAEMKLKQQVQERYKTGQNTTPSTLLSFSTLWLKSNETRVNGHNTLNKKIRFCKEIIKQWGNIDIRDIRVFMVQEYLQDRANQFSSNSFNCYRKEGVALFNWLIKQELVPSGTRNVFDKVEKLPHPKKGPNPTPIADVKKVMAIADPDQYDLLLTYLLTGARKNEILTMVWADIDMDDRTYKLRTKKTGNKLPKTTLHSMPEELYRVFLRKLDKRHPSCEYVFWHRYYSKIEKAFIEDRYTSLNKFTSRLCEKAGVGHFTLHQLRHLAATILKENGASIADLQLFLRHENQKTTELYAGHFNNSTKVQNETLGNFWSKELEDAA